MTLPARGSMFEMVGHTTVVRPTCGQPLTPSPRRNYTRHGQVVTWPTRRVRVLSLPLCKCLVRSERFCDGAIEGAWQDGTFPAALARLRSHSSAPATRPLEQVSGGDRLGPSGPSLK